MLQEETRKSEVAARPAKTLRVVQFAWFAIAAFLVGLALHPTAYADDTSTVQVEVAFGQTEARTMLDMINDFRTGDDAWAWNSTDTEKVYYSGLGTLVYDYDLERIAMQRAAEAAIMMESTHTRPNGQWCFSVEYNGRSSNGENIAGGQSSATQAFVGWQEINEPYRGQGHRRNMLNSSFRSIGIGHVIVNGTHYWCQEFGTAAPSTAPTSALDTMQLVDIEIASNLVDTAAINDISNRRIVLAQGSSRSLPTVPATFKMLHQFPPNKTNSANVLVSDWSIADSSVAHISGNTIVAAGLGQTTLSGTARLGDQTVHLTIPVVVSDNTIEAADVAVSGNTGLTFDGLAKTPSVDSVTYQGRTLVRGTDYQVSYENNVYPSAGEAKIVITGLGSFAGTEQEVPFNIAGLGFWAMYQQYYGNGMSFGFAGSTTHYYDGTAQSQGIFLKLNGTPLREGIDYYLTFSDNVLPGTATTVVNGSGYFSGALSGLNFTIRQTPLSNSSVCTISVPSCSYDGTAQRPPVSVKVNGNELPSSDYAVEYAKNVLPGTATVTVTAASGNVTGGRTVNFQIEGIDLGTVDGVTVDAIPSQIYTGAEIQPVPVVRLKGAALTAGTDYTLSYQNNVNAGRATVTANGIGKYTGAYSAKYDIYAADIANASIELNPRGFYFDGRAKEPAVTATFNGKVLRENVDYRLAYDGDSSIGEHVVTIEGLGNFQGSTTKSYSIEDGGSENGAGGGNGGEGGSENGAGEVDRRLSVGSVLTLGSGTSKASYRVIAAANNGQGQLAYAGPLTGSSAVVIPDTMTVAGKTYAITSIAKNAFAGKGSLVGVRIGKHVRSIPASAFAGCKNLKKVTGGAGVITIGAKAFKGLSKLTSVPAFSKLASIGASAFQGCKALKAFVMGKKVKKVGKNAFNGCKKLTKLTIKSKVLKSVGKGAFKNTSAKMKVNAPKVKKAAYLKMLRKAGFSQKTNKKASQRLSLTVAS